MNESGAMVAETTDEWASWIEANMPQGEDQTAGELRADYLLEQIAEAEAAMAHLNDFTERRIAMIRDHGTAESQKIQNRIDWLASRVRQLVPMDAERFEATYGKKSLNLPNGKIGFRAVQPTVEIHDAAKALDFAKANGLDVTVKESVGKKPLIQYVKDTGTLPDEMEAGFEWVDGYDSFFCKAGK